MDESKEIIKEQLKRIPENLREYVSSSVWSDSVARISKQFNVPQDKVVNLENEVLFVLICLEPPKDFIENIKREVGLDENTARKIADSVNGSILSPVMRDIKSVWENIPKEESASSIQPQTPKPQIKPYDSFEQTILRQAQAMKPAINRAGDSELGTRNNRETETEPQEIKKEMLKTYVKNNDPYREPIE